MIHVRRYGFVNCHPGNASRNDWQRIEPSWIFCSSVAVITTWEYCTCNSNTALNRHRLFCYRNLYDMGEQEVNSFGWLVICQYFQSMPWHLVDECGWGKCAGFNYGNWCGHGSIPRKESWKGSDVLVCLCFWWNAHFFRWTGIATFCHWPDVRPKSDPKTSSSGSEFPNSFFGKPWGEQIVIHYLQWSFSCQHCCVPTWIDPLYCVIVESSSREGSCNHLKTNRRTNRYYCMYNEPEEWEYPTVAQRSS